jgi:hypothetical protein
MCRRSARSSGQYDRSAYSCKLWKAGNGRAAGMRAKHILNERSNRKKWPAL